MVEVETIDDIVEEIADQLGIYNEEGSERSFFTADLSIRIRGAVANEKIWYKR